VDSAPVDLEDHVLLDTQQPLWVRSLLDALAEANIPFVLVADGGTRHVDWLQGSSGTKASVAVYVPSESADKARSVQARVIGSELPDVPEGYDPFATSGDRCPACDASLTAGPQCPGCGLYLG